MKDCPVCNEVGGPLVECVECGMPKPPAGRSVAREASSGYCDFDCPGYRQDPQPSGLWPNERYGDSLGHMDWHDEYREKESQSVGGQSNANRYHNAVSCKWVGFSLRNGCKPVDKQGR